LSQRPDGISLADASPPSHYLPIEHAGDATGRNRKSHRTHGRAWLNEYTTFSKYDIQGNLLEVKDALGRIAFKNVYDLAKHPFAH